MMHLEPKPTFYDRVLHQPIPEVFAVKFRVESMEWNDFGGPSHAEILARAGRAELLNLLSLLGAEMDIASPWGFAWWGYTHSITLELPGMEIVFTLDRLHNRIAMAYTYVGPGAPKGGIRKTTDYTQDTDSVAAWGTHEFLHSGNNLTDAAALAQRDMLLALSKVPQGGASLLPSGNSMTARITCRGYLDSLDWRMASVPAEVAVSYTTTGAAEDVLGSSAGELKKMQQFTVAGADIHVVQAKIYIKTVGSPVDDITVEICELDGSGNPVSGAALASGSIAGYTLTSSFSWAQVDFSDTVLAAGQYGLVISRSAEDATNYYKLNVNESLGYTGGAYKMYNGSAWNTRSPDADLPFAVYIDPQVANTQQIANLVTTYGEYLEGVIVEAASDSVTGSVRDGDTTVLSEIVELLKPGGPNDRKYMALVNRERYLVIKEQPAKGASYPYYFINGKGGLLEGTLPAHPFDPMLGQWVGMHDFPYDSTAVTYRTPGLQYTKGAVWARGQGIQPQFEGLPNADEFLEVYT